MIAQRMEGFTLQEIVIARALPNPIPALTGLYLSDIVELRFIFGTKPKGGTNPYGNSVGKVQNEKNVAAGAGWHLN